MLRHFLLIVAMLLGAGCLASAPGCTAPQHGDAAQSTLQRWVTARESLTQAQNVAVALHSAGLLKDSAIVQIDPWVKIARNAIAAAELPGADVEGNLATADQAISQIKTITADGQKAEPVAATKTTEATK